MLASNNENGAAIVKLLLACPGIELNLQNKVNSLFLFFFYNINYYNLASLFYSILFYHRPETPL